MKLKTLVSGIIGICLAIALCFTINPDTALAAGVIHNGDPCFSNDYNYEGQWVIGDIPGLGAPETKICIRGTAKKSSTAFSVKKGDYCYKKSEDNKSYLSSVIEKNGIYGCGYPEPEPYTAPEYTNTDPLSEICTKNGGQMMFEDPGKVAVCEISSPGSAVFKNACEERQGHADIYGNEALCFDYSQTFALNGICTTHGGQITYEDPGYITVCKISSPGAAAFKSACEVNKGYVYEYGNDEVECFIH